MKRAVDVRQSLNPGPHPKSLPPPPRIRSALPLRVFTPMQRKRQQPTRSCELIGSVEVNVSLWPVPAMHGHSTPNLGLGADFGPALGLISAWRSQYRPSMGANFGLALELTSARLAAWERRIDQKAALQYAAADRPGPQHRDIADRSIRRRTAKRSPCRARRPRRAKGAAAAAWSRFTDLNR